MLNLFLLATIPPLLIVFFVYRNDLYEKEPHKLLISTFLLGCVLIIPMIILETLTQMIFTNVFFFSLLGIALVEEGVKYIALLKYNLPKKDFNEPYDGIIYSLFLTMGFALVENISYVIGNEETGFSVAIARMFTAIPMHATCGIVMGYYLGLSKMKTSDKSKNLTLSILLPVLIHGLYNYFLFVDFPLLSLLIVVFGVVYARKAIKLHQEQSPFKKT